MKRQSPLSTALLTAALALAGGAAFAQGGAGFLPPPDAMDNLSNMGSPNAAPAMDAANNAANAANQGFGGGGFQPPPAGGGFGAPGGFGGFGDGGFTPPDESGFGEAGVETQVAIPRPVTAIGGMRIKSKLSGRLLQDARTFKIMTTSTNMYFDDGKSGGDAVANDQVFTNIVETDTFISPEEQLVKTKIINGLKALERLTPQEFTQVRVATSDPISSLPKLGLLEAQQDSKIKLWAMNFLEKYRVNPDSMTSELFPTFLPPPPMAPVEVLPMNFSPRWRPSANPSGTGAGEGDGEGVIAGRSLDDDVTGTPIGAASSRYF